MHDKLLITVAPSIPPPGMATGIPGLDLTPEDIADGVESAFKVGANIAL
jgi:uncharacterized protein (DUF849 family)